MKTNFIAFLNESKTYNLYKGVFNLDKILKSGKISNSNDWNTLIRKNLNIPEGIGISSTRVFSTAAKYGVSVIEFDIDKLSANYRIIPFSENPDYFLWYKKHFGEPGSDKYVKQGILDYQYDDIFWDYKTNKHSADFNIAEELILAKEIPTSYIKKVYLFMSPLESSEYTKLLMKRNIPYEFVDDEHLSKIKMKNIRNKKNILDFDF